jgi:DNA-binding FadR family transcriptional regulator
MTSEIERRPTFDAQRQIKRVIIDANLAAGDPLPTETQLMALLGISRGSLREALKGLQARGIVEVVHGRGMFVGQLTMDALIDGLTFHLQLGTPPQHRRVASELTDVRDILEGALVQQVAHDADADLLAVLERIVVEMERTGAEAAPFQDLDREFHTVLYRAIDNEIVTKLILAFWHVLEVARPDLPESHDDRGMNASHHRAILDRLRARDASGAGEAMKRHFAGTHRWIQTPSDPT